MPFGRKHAKIAQLCEDKGKACTGSQPSSSIWVSSSLSPGGTWKYGSYGGPEWIYCHLLAPLVWTTVRCKRAWLLVIYTPWFTTDERPVQSEFQVPLTVPLHWTTELLNSQACMFAHKHFRINRVSHFFSYHTQIIFKASVKKTKCVYKSVCKFSGQSLREKVPSSAVNDLPQRKPPQDPGDVTGDPGCSYWYVDKTEGWENQSVTVGVAKWQWLQFIIRTETSWLAEKF